MTSNPPSGSPTDGSHFPTNASAFATNPALALGAARTQTHQAQDGHAQDRPQAANPLQAQLSNGQTFAQNQFTFQPQITAQGQAQAQAQQQQNRGQLPSQFQFQALGSQNQGQSQTPFQPQAFGQPRLQGQQQQAPYQFQMFGQPQFQGQRQASLQFQPQGSQNQGQVHAGFGQAQSQGQQQNPFQFQPQVQTQQHQAQPQNQQVNGQTQGQALQHQTQLQSHGQRQATAQQQNLQALGRLQAGLGQNQPQGMQQNPFQFQSQGQAQQLQAQLQNQSLLSGATQQQNHAQHQQANVQPRQNLGQQQITQGFGQPQGGLGQAPSQGLQQNLFQLQPQGQILRRQVQPQNQLQLQAAAAQQQNHGQHQGLSQPQFQTQQQNPLQPLGQQHAPFQLQPFGRSQFEAHQQAPLQFQGQGQSQLPPPDGFFVPNPRLQSTAPAPVPIPLWFEPPRQQQQQLPLQGYGEPGEEPAGVIQFQQGLTVRQGRTQDELDALGINGTEFVENLDDADFEDVDEAVQAHQGQEDTDMQDADPQDTGAQVQNMPNDQQQQDQVMRGFQAVEDPHMYDAVIYEDAWDTESEGEPDIEVETLKVGGTTKQRYKFTEAFLKEHFNGRDPYYKEKREVVPLPPSGLGMDIITALCKNLELAIELGKHLRGEDILNLYIACRGFREALDGHMLSSIREWIRSRAPEAGRLFPWRSVAKFLVPDPAQRSSSGPGKTPGEVRLIPGMKYLQMILGRDRYCHQILAVMARMGFRVPDTMHTTLLRIWHLLEVATCAQRAQLMADTSLWTDQHLYNAQFFFVKLTMAFNHPFFAPHSHEMLHLMMGQRGLYPLWQCLTRKKFRTMSEIIELKARYDMNLPPPAWFDPNRRFMVDFYGVPFRELGTGHCEGWGAGSRHLLRPDELIVTESITRGLDLEKHLSGMLLWGYIDFKTGENLVPTEEEMYISDEEEVLDGVDTTCHWQKRHALKKRWNQLTPEQRQEIEEDEEDERLRAMAWSAQYDPDEKNDRHARKWDSESEDESDQEYDPNVEINRGYRMQALPKDQPSQVPSLDDKAAWSNLCNEFLMTTQVEVSDDEVAKASAWLKFSRANMVAPFDQDRYDMGDPFMRSRIDWSPPLSPMRIPDWLRAHYEEFDADAEGEEEEGEEGEDGDEDQGEGGDEDDWEDEESDDEEDYEDYYDDDGEMEE